MKLRNLFYLLLALPLVFAACENGSEDVNDTPAPEKEYAAELTLTSEATMDVVAEAGDYEITYTAKMVEVTREAAPATVTAECAADWVTIGEVTDTKALFSVAANEGEAREAKIVVKYSTESFEVTVKQAAKEQGKEPEKEYAAELTLTSEDTMEVAAEAGDYEITYTAKMVEVTREDAPATVTAECAADWVTTGEVTDTKALFSVAANEGEAREAKIVVKYSTESFEVTVKQAAKEPEQPIVPQDPTPFTPVKVTANHYDTGNFIINLFVTDSTRHEFDIYDKVNPNDNNLSDGTYSSEDGSIGLEYSFFYNGEKNVGMANAELTFKLNEDWTMTITGEFASVEGVAHTIDWTGVVEGFKYDGQPVDFLFSTENIVRSSTKDGQTWDLVFFEDNANFGDPMTRITVSLAEVNKLHITDGTYTIADGSIVTSDNNVDSGSYYRYSRPTDGGAMTECELTVAIDKEAEKAKLSGYFVAGGTTVNFEYYGAVNGFLYKEVGDEGITNWDKFILRNQYEDCKVLWGYTNGNLDAPFVEFSIYKLGGQKADPIAAGTYTVGDWEYITSRDYCANDAGGVNGKYVKSGEVVIEIVDEGYKVTFDVVDEAGDSWKGTYVGEIPYEPYKG